MPKFQFFTIFLFLSLNTLSQEKEFHCGYKDSCSCEETNVNNSFGDTPLVFSGIVISVDTVKISEIITVSAFDKLSSDTSKTSSCARKILTETYVTLAQCEIIEMFKGILPQHTVVICSPTADRNCGYSNFEAGKEFIVYATSDNYADIFYTYTLDHDYYELESEYTIWTNKCQLTSMSTKDHLSKLAELKRTKHGDR